MHGYFWTYRDGMNGAIPGVDANDQFGNIRANGRPRKGEHVDEWIKRIVQDALDNSSPNAWWQRMPYTISVRIGYGRGAWSVVVSRDV